MTAWTAAQRRNGRSTYHRLYQHDGGTKVRPVTVPDDITILTRDPSPCFACGVRGACRHRPWERDLIEQSA